MKHRAFLVITFVCGIVLLGGCAKKKPFQIPRYEIASEDNYEVTEEVNEEHEEIE